MKNTNRYATAALIAIVLISALLQQTMNPIVSSSSTVTYNIVFKFSEAVAPADISNSPDTRKLAVAFHTMEFLSSLISVLSTLYFGTAEANRYQGIGWFINENSDIGTFQWAGGIGKYAVLTLPGPADAFYIKLNMSPVTSLPGGASLPPMTMGISVNGEDVYSFELPREQGWQTWAIPLRPQGVTPISDFSLPELVIPNGFGVQLVELGDLDLITNAGFKFIRNDLCWEGVEKQLGTYEFRYSSGTDVNDALVEGCSKRGIRMICILDYSNPLYESNRSVRTENGRKAFANFAEAAARRYAGKGILWEIWNEPNIDFGWNPQPGIEDYCRLVNETAPRIKEADPTGYVVAPASAEIPFGWLEDCFKRGLLDWIDALTVHAYRGGPPETVIEDYAKLRSLISSYVSNGKEIPIISGEWGYPMDWTWLDISEEKQAQYLARMFLVNLYESIPISVWYRWKDVPSIPDFGLSGVITSDLKPKMAYFAIKTLTQMLGGYRIVERLNLGNENDFALRLMKDKNEAIAFWTVDEEHEVTLPIGAGNGTLIDMVGNQSTVSWETIDGLRVNISQSPHYLMIDRLITAKFEHTPEKPTANEQITFNASESYSLKGTMTSYEWDFGDSNVTRVTQPLINHTYALPGKYTIIVNVTDNNTLWDTTTKTITVYYGTDLNKDGTVNILDIFIVAKAFGTTPGVANWNATADLNKDGTVNILDIFAVAWDFGKTY